MQNKYYLAAVATIFQIALTGVATRAATVSALQIAGAPPTGINNFAGTGGALNNPIFATYAPGDATHLYVVEKENGTTTNVTTIIQQGAAGGAANQTSTTLTRGTAEIKVIDLTKPLGSNVTSFLTISTVTPTGAVNNGGNTFVNTTQEMGLLGLAFDPGYNTPGNPGFGKFYVNISGFSADTNTLGQQMYGTQNIVQYHADPTTGVATAAQDGTLLSWNNPWSAQHKAGWIGFSPQVNPNNPGTTLGGTTIRANDGENLYITTGDGSLFPTGYDAFHQAQDTSTLLGKVLRIHVNPANATYSSAGNNVTPNVAATALPEIFSYGYRNPFRISFDRANGNLYIADVGQDSREEIDLQQASNPNGGENYGWSLHEGAKATPAPTTTEVNKGPTSPILTSAGPGSSQTIAVNGTTPLVDPILDYGHITTDTTDMASALGASTLAGTAIIGGYVYRGTAIPALAGKLLFSDLTGVSNADNGRSQIFAATLSADGTTITSLLDLTNDLNPGTSSSTQRFRGLVSFGEDAAGNLYMMDQAQNQNAPQSSGNGSVWEIMPVPEPGSALLLIAGSALMLKRRRGRTA